MKEYYTNLNKEFQKIKNQGWTKGKKYEGIDRTLENHLRIKENTLEISDYNHIEIKTKRSNSKSYVSLFNITPKEKHNYEIKYLNDKYGYPEHDFKNLKVLQESVYCNKRTWIGNKYQFMLQINQLSKKYIFAFLISMET